MSVASLESLHARFPQLRLPPLKEPGIAASKSEVLLVTSGDSRLSANRTCWPVQAATEARLESLLKEKFGIDCRRTHPRDAGEGHGFIASQREGSDVFAGIDPSAPVIVLLTAWQYSYHLAPSLVHHRGPILLLANFNGTWPGLVGALNLAGSLTALGVAYSRLWSEQFDDDFFLDKLGEFLGTGRIVHDLSYLRPVSSDDPRLQGEAGELGRYLGEWVLRNKELIGYFDSFCMGMINGVFPQKALCDIGMPMEGLSQSQLLYEMSLVTPALREQCLGWYLDRGMTFRFGADPATELTREQVLEQCAMLIAMARITDRLGLSCVGVQYQQGLKDCCAASDFAEGALGSSLRFPIPDHDGRVIRPGLPIPHANEVDMGSAIPQTMLFRLLSSLGLPAETTLHDVRWGSEYEGVFYWDFQISGAIPFEHVRGGITGATGHRQPPMYFAKGGATLSGQGKAGCFIWARAYYRETTVYLHIGTGDAVELPAAEWQRRSAATTSVWPLMNARLHGISRDQFMAGHQSNHITIAYVDPPHLALVTGALAAMAIRQGMQVEIAGTPVL